MNAVGGASKQPKFRPDVQVIKIEILVPGLWPVVTVSTAPTVAGQPQKPAQHQCDDHTAIGVSADPQ